MALLRWRQDGLEIEVRELRWRLPADLWRQLWRERHLSLDELAAAEISIRDERSPTTDAGSPLPADLRLPWLRSVNIPLVVDRLHAQAVDATDIRLRYAYGADSQTPEPAKPATPLHRLVIEGAVLRMEANAGVLTAPLRANVTLHAGAEPRLTAEADAVLHAAPVGAPPQRVQAAVRLSGSLANDGVLTADVDLHSADGPTSAMLRATLSPWATWPLREARATMQALDLSVLWPHWPRTRLDGTLSWQPDSSALDALESPTDWRVQAQWINRSPAPWNRQGLPLESAEVDLQVNGNRARLAHLQVRAGGGTARATGDVQWSANTGPTPLARLQALQGVVTVRNVVPARLWAGADDAPLTMTLQVEPLPRQPLTAALAVDLDARQGPARVTARGHWVRDAGLQGRAAVQIPGLSARFDGFAGRPSRLPPSAPPPPAQSNLSVKIDRLSATQTWLQQTAARWAPLWPGLPDAVSAWTQPTREGELDLNLRWGLEPTATLTARAALTQDGRRWHLTLAPTTLAWTAADPRHGSWTVGASQLQLGIGQRPDAPTAQATLQWEPVQWRDGIVQAQGRLDPVRLLPWLRMLGLAPPENAAVQPTADAAVQARWSVAWPLGADDRARAATRPRVTLLVARTAGDVLLPAGDGTGVGRVAGGLRTAQVDVDWDGQRLQTLGRWDSERAGQVTASLQATPPAEPANALPWPISPDTMLSGSVQAQWPSLAVLAPWLPPGWRVDGRLQTDAQIGGTWATPTVVGTVEGASLRLASLADGIDWRDGHLHARLTERTLDIEQLRFTGTGGIEAGGMLSGSGRVGWTPGSPPMARLNLQAQRWRVLARADRRLTLSGDMALLAEARRLSVNGELRVDQARWRLPDADTPRLGDDVVVRGAPPAPAASGPWPPGWTGAVDVALALGSDFWLEGRGLDTRLTGSLRWQQNDAQPPRLSGEVNTRNGRYRAYGQTLEIARGALRFGGVVDDPALDLLAVRSQPQQTVGVAVSGTARAPRVRLYAEPSLPDSEILAWLVLGRPATGVGAESALLQRAALALLSGTDGGGVGLPSIVGLDELAYEGEGTNADGTPRAGAVSLGKRLSNRLYLGYRRSLVGLVGTVSVLYDVSRRLTLRAQAGDDNAIELLYTRRYD